MNIQFYNAAPPVPGGRPLLNLLCKLLEERHPWLRASYQSVPVPDSVNLIDKMDPAERKHAFPFTWRPTDFYLARAASGPPKHKYDNKHPDLRFIGTISLGGETFLTPHQEFAKDPRKLAGRPVGLVHAIEADHWGAPMIQSLAILKDAWGIYDKIKPVQVRMSDMGKAFATGKADAIFGGRTSYQNGKFYASDSLLALLNEKKFYWIPITQEELDRTDAANGWKTRLITMPKGSLNQPDTPPDIVNPPEDITLIGTCSALAAWQDTEDEVVYELLKFFVDNADDLAKANEYLSLDPETLSRYPGLTRDLVHSGALRYYQEQGIEIDEA